MNLNYLLAKSLTPKLNTKFLGPPSSYQYILRTAVLIQSLDLWYIPELRATLLNLLPGTRKEYFE